MTQEDIKIVFFGTPGIGYNSLDFLNKTEGIKVCAVVTQPDKPADRGHKIKQSPIKIYAQDFEIPILQPKSIRKEPEIIEELKKYEPDFFVTFAFGQILSQEVLDIPKYATINLHASLLPKYRGANPIQRAIINGEKETGICTMITELGLDCGDICEKLVIPISDTMNCEELWKEIGNKAPEMILNTIVGLKNGLITPRKQDEDGVCMAPKLTKEECQIDWNKANTDIHNLVRGICRSPGAYFKYNDKIVKVIESKPVDGNGKIGEIIAHSKEGVDIACANGALRLIKVKPESKGEMFARDWYNGVKK